ncbi:hypothetical protein ACO1O0_007769 [Amphichorda felina]
MRITSHPTEDTGLADSTYELISGVEESESWSQDGNDHEYISESVSSLDPHRPDDVQSLADTEQMTDDEFIPMPALASPSHSPASVTLDVASIPLPDDDNSDSGSDSDSEASRSSLEYTQQSLKTPSMSTPEASKIYERPPSMHPTLEFFLELYTTWIAQVKNHVQYIRRGLEDGSVSMAHPTIVISGLIQALVFGLAVHSALSIMKPVLTDVHQAQPVPSVTTTAPGVLELRASPSSTSPSENLTTSHSSTELTLRYDDDDDDERAMDWLFGSRKPEVTFSAQPNNIFLAQIPKEVKKVWAANDCVEFTAARDGQPVKTTVDSFGDGMLLRFPRWETYGVVDLTFKATCNPVLKKVVKVRFVKGMREGVFELTKHAVRDLAPVAERGLAEIKKVVEPARESFIKYSQALVQLTNADELVVMKNGIPNMILTGYDNLRNELSRASKDFKGAQKHAADLVHDVQTRLQLELLNAQISAKLSWLAIIGKKDEHDEYLRKATSFMNSKEAAARERRSRAA